jgi:hypothetical protein
MAARVLNKFGSVDHDCESPRYIIRTSHVAAIVLIQRESPLGKPSCLAVREGGVLGGLNARSPILRRMCSFKCRSARELGCRRRLGLEEGLLVACGARRKIPAGLLEACKVSVRGIRLPYWDLEGARTIWMQSMIAGSGSSPDGKIACHGRVADGRFDPGTDEAGWPDHEA